MDDTITTPQAESAARRPFGLLRLMLAMSWRREITIMSIEKTLQEHTRKLMAIPGVVGVAEGEKGGAPVIIVMVSELTPELRDQLPRQLGDIPVEIDKTGEITAF